MKFGCQQFCSNEHSAEIVLHSKNSLFEKNFRRNLTISRGIPNLGVWCKKWSNLDFRNQSQTKKSKSYS